MKLSYEIEQKYASKFIGFLTLGILYSLKKGIISIDEAEVFLFKPYVAELLKELQSSKKLIKIIYLGCELEDVESLIPDRLQDNIEELFEETLSFIKNISDGESIRVDKAPISITK